MSQYFRTFTLNQCRTYLDTFLELWSATSVYTVLLYFQNDYFIYVRTNGQYKTVNCFILTV